jgi:phosphatidylserine/phosphatidylglycerophosphate/cardiolipin synthase-like enzyme
MHDKFVVIDRTEVWTGSMNFTTSGAYKDNNNLICIRSSKVAEDYSTEFNEMFVENLFGPDARAETPYPSLKIDGTRVEIYFSPDDDVAARLLSLIQEAKDSIQFMAYSFTANDLGDAIIQRAAEGLTVAGVMDDDQIISNQGTEYDAFTQAGLDVRRDGNAGQMHHKVIIIDRSIVITGSYNFSSSADTSNDENVVILYSPEAAAKYLEEFQKVYNQAQPVLPPE